MTLSRRDVLKVGTLGAIGAAGLGGLGSLPFGGAVLARDAGDLDAEDLPTPFRAPFVRPPVLRPVHWEYDGAGNLVRQHYHVVARETSAQILPRHGATRLWGYNGLVPGPTIKVDRGVETIVRVRNKLPEIHPLFGHEFYTSTHLHGSASLPQYDGYADDITPPGFYKDYHFPNYQGARTIWYHDHAVHYTAKNAYSGLLAQYHIHDPQESRLLPQGEFDVPVTVTDALFGDDGQLLYDDESQSGLYGDVILVNGRPWPTMKVQRRVYRFRFLTASASRSYRFQLNGGDPMHMVATDGGLMPATQTVTQWRQGSGERYEVLIDFRRYRGGQRVVLENLSNDNNRDYDHTGKVMAFDVLDDTFGAGQVDRRDPTWNRVPGELSPSHVMKLTAASAVRSRHLEMGRTGGEWTINDTTWTDVARSGYQKVLASPGVGDVEMWTIENGSGGWFHPTHIHLVDFRVLDRNGRPPEAYEQGPKDTVYVAENETVNVVARFGDPDRPETRGRYMVHCHNLVHEDHDMMSQFAVGWKPGDPEAYNHPIAAAPSKLDDLPEEVGVAPGRPEAPEVDEIGRGWVDLEWDEPDENDDDVIGYRIRGFAGGALVFDHTADDRRKLTITDLASDQPYTFSVAAISPAGTGPQSPRSRPVTVPSPRSDRRRPRVVRRRPRRNARNVARGRNVRARFTEPVERVSGRTVRLRRAGGRRVRARVTTDPSTQRVTINPRRRLAPDTRYRVRFTRRIRDEAGNRLRPASWGFKTRGRPRRRR